MIKFNCCSFYLILTRTEDDGVRGTYVPILFSQPGLEVLKPLTICPQAYTHYVQLAGIIKVVEMAKSVSGHMRHVMSVQSISEMMENVCSVLAVFSCDCLSNTCSQLAVGLELLRAGRGGATDKCIYNYS